jgi:excisionase family DNA binding protein
MENLLNVQQVAQLLGIHHKKIQRLARTGVLPRVKIGAVYRFQPAALDAWVKKRLNCAV